MAFQPIVDLHRKEIFSYEALARGADGESAATVFSRVGQADEYAFDDACRARAIRLAAQVGMDACLNLNFQPNSVYHPGTSIRMTLRAARQMCFPVDRIVFEITEWEPIADVVRLAAIVREYQRHGFRTAIDDFGAGYAGLGLLADLRPNFVKIDIGLTHDIDADRVRRVIVEGIMSTCRALSIEVIAEGIETIGAMNTLPDLGVRYFQGCLFARPGLESLPEVHWPAGFEPNQYNDTHSSERDMKVRDATRVSSDGKQRAPHN
jgi:EAL domain-containing protein (putative c-di-GMP-specific phosphodiesterase class I)